MILIKIKNFKYFNLTDLYFNIVINFIVITIINIIFLNMILKFFLLIIFYHTI